MRKSALVLALLAGSALAVYGIATAQDAGTATQGAQGPSAVDQQFVTAAVRANDQEIDEAQAELNGNGDATVKMYANRMITDHSTANSQVGAIAQNLNLSFPKSHIAVSEPDTKASAPPAAMRSSQQPAMSAKAYMTKEVADHQQAIALYENEAHNGSSSQLRTYAAQTLPTLKAHLTMAQQYVATGNMTPVATPTPAGQQ